MSQVLSMSIHNATQRSRVVLLEPWGLEFMMVPNEKLEITARSGPDGAGLRVVEADHRTLVFVEGCSAVRVIKDGMTYNLGPEAIDEVPAPRALPARRDVDPMWDRALDG
jgi:hypothetical protein